MKIIFVLGLLLATVVALVEGEIWIFSAGNIGSLIIRINESFLFAFAGIVAFVFLLAELDELTKD